MKFRISRKRREFGAPVFLSDRNVSDAKDGFVECPSFDDDSYGLLKKELDKGIQVCESPMDTCTEWLTSVRQKAHRGRVLKSSWLRAKIGAYLVSIGRLLFLAFLYGWHVLNKISLDWPRTWQLSCLTQNFLTTLRGLKLLEGVMKLGTVLSAILCDKRLL